MDTKSTSIIGGVIVIVLAIGGVLWYMSEHPAPVKILHDGADGLMPTVPPQVIEEQWKYYEIRAEIPGKTPLSATADAQAIETMRQYALSVIADFKQQGDFENLTAQDIQMFGYDQERKQSLEITFETKSGSRTVSYVFMQYQDTLGAHPNTYFRTFTFDLSSGALLSMGDLFMPGADYLSLLSSKARAVLPGQLAGTAQTDLANINVDFITDGTKPEKENFERWYITEDTLVLVFPPYQVAAYVFGAPEVRLPLSTLPDMKPLYRSP